MRFATRGGALARSTATRSSRARRAGHPRRRPAVLRRWRRVEFAGKERARTVNLPIVLSGQTVQAGDVIIGDTEGVAVVPFAKIDEVIVGLEGIRAAEAALLARVAAGLGVPEWVEELHRDRRVREV